MTAHISLSGGLDSTSALAAALQEHDDVRAWTVLYGQRHARELDAAQAVADHYSIPCQAIDARGLLTGSSLLDGTPVPHGHYAADTMRATVVNGRNLLFAALVIARAQPGDEVWLGVHGGDHHIYPDCRPDFIDPLALAVHAAYGIAIRAPFLHTDKAGAASLGHTLGAPLHLTWSCYEGGQTHCGRCGTCVERAEAFHLAGIPDPTQYADPHYWQTA